MVPIDNNSTDKLNNWYWASFHDLQRKIEQSLLLTPADTLDALLTKLILSPHRTAQNTSIGDFSAFNGMESDRKKLAAFGAYIYIQNIEPDLDTAASFEKGLEKILRQRQDDSDAWSRSPRLVLGISMGIKQLAQNGSIANLGKEVGQRVETSCRKPNGQIRDLILLANALTLLTIDSDTRKKDLESTTQYILAQPIDGLGDRDVAAIMWGADNLGGYLDPQLRKQLESLADDCVARLPNLQVQSFDAIDNAMMKSFLTSLASRIGTSGITTGLQRIEAALDSFSDLVLALSQRRKGKATIQVEDEYDVQDILYVTLKPAFPDLEREEPTPKDLGANKRIDLVSAVYKIVIEIKIVRDQKHAQSIFDEIKVDLQSYHTHPSCKELWFFIYDPEKLIQSARQREKEFMGPMEVRPGKVLNVTLRIRP